MPAVDQRDLENLANIIMAKIRSEFETKHLSGNLMNTLHIEEEDGKVRVIIPARTYNMLLYQLKGVVVHTSHGSYASKLDERGSEFYAYPQGTRKGSRKIRPHNHKGYVDKVIKEAINEWLSGKSALGWKGKVTEI